MLALLNCSNGCRSSFKETGSSLNYNKCIICQEDNKQQKLVAPTSDGLKTIHSARQVRLKLRNNNFRSATDRLTDALAACPSPLIVCHNGCRAPYTSSHKLERLSATDITVDQIQSSSSARTHSRCSITRNPSMKQGGTNQLELVHSLPKRDQGKSPSHTRDARKQTDHRSI